MAGFRSFCGHAGNGDELPVVTLSGPCAVAACAAEPRAPCGGKILAINYGLRRDDFFLNLLLELEYRGIGAGR